MSYEVACKKSGSHGTWETTPSKPVWPCLKSAVCTCLSVHNSGSESARELLKPSEDSASLRVINEKIFFLVLCFRYFVDVIIVVLGFFGPLHMALDPNC